MRLNLIKLILLLTLVQVSAKALGQVTLNHQDAPLEDVLKNIEKQSGVVFFYDYRDVASARVTIHINSLSLEETLKTTLKNLPLNYRINGKEVYLRRVEPVKVEKPVQPQEVNIQGRVADSLGNPLSGATIRVKDSNRGAVTGNEGEFRLSSQNPDAILTISSLGYESVEFTLRAFPPYGAVEHPTGVIGVQNEQGVLMLSIVLLQSMGQLAETVVTVNTGYEKINPERMTGSYVTIDNDLLNRRVSTNILDRIDGVTSGLIFNKTAGNYNGREPSIAIRGRSTINANAEPLIILDNFPYDGDLSSINPNDVSTITVLKDAAAASVWGAQSGNGVVVITTKQGGLNQAPKISVTANTTIGQKPDLYYSPQLTSTEYIEVEKFLFDQGMYDNALATDYQAVSPAVDIFAKMKNGELPETEGNQQLDMLRNTDIRRQQEKYLYHHSLNQQYNLNVQGGGQHQRYYLSAGYDRTDDAQIKNIRDRFTLNTNNSFSLLKDKLQLSSQVLFTKTNSHNSAYYTPRQPYERIADENGNPLAVTPLDGLRPAFIDTVGSARLLDWHYYPLQEIQKNYAESNGTQYRINLSADYKIIPELTASIQYQYNRGISDNKSTYQSDSYYTRNLINSFSQIDPATGVITRPIPLGDILLQNPSNFTSKYGRGQLSFDKVWNDLHHVTAFAAFEVKDMRTEGNTTQLYGYDPSTAAFANVDYLTYYPQIPTGLGQQIRNPNNQSFGTDRFRSYIGNLSYTYKEKYTIYGSFRRDESNLFGVETNQKGVPLWSVGGSWIANKEIFYHADWINNLKIRLSYGKQGNIDRTVSALLTARNLSGTNSYGDLYAELDNPPNPSLRWEQVAIWNGGIDFSLLNNFVNGTVDIYQKKGTDLIANSSIAPQTGLVSFRGNVANIRANGIDVTLEANWFRKRFSWTTDVLYSHVTDKITKYNAKQSTNLDYMRNNYINPFEGYPYSALFSFPYGGLDKEGNPQGYVNGELTTDYSVLASQTGIENMIYNGSQVPTHFGSVRNTFTYNNLSFSFNIIYKMGYSFRRYSLDNSQLYSQTPYRQIPDYANRWQNQGDEQLTNVPSLVYPVNSSRSNFYQYSEALIEKGDHIRLQDIQLSYTLDKKKMSGLPVDVLKIYGYVNNIGILWRANDKGIDPDVFQVGSYPSPTTFSVGLTGSF